MAWQILVGGVSIGVVYGLVAMGMVMIWRTVSIVNFAQGEFLMFGGFLCYTFNQLLGINIVISLIITAVLMIFVGIIFQRFTYWPMRKAQLRAIVACLMGAAMVFREGSRLIWGSVSKVTDRVVEENIQVSPTTILQGQYLTIIGVAALLMFLVYILLERTFLGHIMQATAQDKYMASMAGIPVVLSISLTFGVSALLAGICGGLLGPIFYINSTMGATVGAKAFAAIVIGGFGSVQGAIVGGLIVGLVEAFGGVYISSLYQLAIVYVVLMGFLMFRPQGIFGEKIQEKA